MGCAALPLAALHDGEQFLIEKYSLTRIPAFNLIQTDYTPLRPGNILAMGASEFDAQEPLPAVPTELSSILSEVRSGPGLRPRYGRGDRSSIKGLPCPTCVCGCGHNRLRWYTWPPTRCLSPVTPATPTFSCGIASSA